MKCIQNRQTLEVRRLKDDEAHSKVRRKPEKWGYVTKGAWKAYRARAK